MTNDEKKRKVPQLRFKGFTDDWEQRKLGEVAKIVGGGTPSTSIPEYWNGEIDWYSPAEIGSQRFLNGSHKKITSLGLQKSSAKILPSGTILFTSRAGIGNTGILREPGATNQGFQSIIPIPTLLDSYFIYSKTFELKKYGETTGSGSTFIEISGKQMQKMPLKVPSIKEQGKVGIFFKGIDDTIALHQRKHELLLKLKQGFLQKLFPKNGEKVPELRFPGFTDDWEQRKLGDLGSVAMNRRIFKNQTSETGDVPFYKIGSFGGTPDAFISRKLFEKLKKSYPYPEKGDLLISASGSIGKIVQYRGEDAYFQDSNIVWLKHDTHVKNSFLKQFYEVVKWQGLEGSTIKRLYNKNILTTTIWLPSEKEQTKIGAFFERLDDTIALHQEKIDKLKTLKQAYLQKMFV